MSCWQSAKRDDRRDAAGAAGLSQLAVFFEKISAPEEYYRRRYSALAGSRQSTTQETPIPPELDVEVQNYQRSQLLSTSQFIVQLPQILGQLHQLHSPFAAGRNSWWMTMRPSRPHYIPCFTALASESGELQAATLNQQLLDEEHANQLLRRSRGEDDPERTAGTGAGGKR